MSIFFFIIWDPYDYNLNFSIHIFHVVHLIEQKGLTFDHNFDYSFLPFSSLLKKGEQEKENEYQKSWSKVIPFCSICAFSHTLYYSIILQFNIEIKKYITVGENIIGTIKVYWPNPAISMRLKWKLSHLTWHLGRIT